jgi:SAM-dependent methyltransferase
MEPATMSDLHDLQSSIAFYEARYEQGYMEDYSLEAKQRIVDVIRALDLPREGAALDFGCGNGVLTDIIREALPNWKIYGTDLSKKAIANARARFPGCVFVEMDDPFITRNGFDLIFSNHVLEHVNDLASVAEQMNRCLKPDAAMLHFMPCGNAGSYEHKLCLLRKDGINKELGNRFFFEDEGHLRRLTTEQLRGLFETIGFRLAAGYYSHHYYGSIDWITNWDLDYLRQLTDPSKAVDASARLALLRMRMFLMTVALCRRHARLCERLMANRNKRPKHIVASIVMLPLYPATRMVERRIRQKTKSEWSGRRLDPGGSEMALYFTRHAKA